VLKNVIILIDQAVNPCAARILATLLAIELLYILRAGFNKSGKMTRVVKKNIPLGV
jgi:hypothetical protein